MPPIDKPAQHSQSWLNNSLLDESFLLRKAQELSSSASPHQLNVWLPNHFDAQRLAQCNEAQLEKEFINPLLEQLGWVCVPQESFVVQGKTAKPDWLLLLDEAHKTPLLVDKDTTLITAICEAKNWGAMLDTGKANDANPHHQLQNYLSTLRVRYGVLTNARVWRFYDTDKISAKKTFVEIDLERLLALEDAEEKAQGLALFGFLFARDSFAANDALHEKSAIEKTLADADEFALEVEENLKAVIYGFDGEDSLFEIMGKAIYKANAKRGVKLEEVYENSLILLFRLLFIVYFEDKNKELLERHPFYKRFSVKALYANLRDAPDERANLHDGIFSLKQLFDILDGGAEDIDIPLFNGGLFDPARAALLQQPKLLDNQTLRVLLEKLLYKTERGTTLFDTRRDFKNISVTHLGRIYEGLLQFRFEKATESATYLEYESSATKGKSVEAYFDAYDAANIRKEKGFRKLREQSVRKGEVYLKSSNNSRKSSASYYTPSALSQRLVKASIDHAREAGRALQDIKILDNACGSGHFLVEALGYLTDLALDQLPNDEALQALVTSERDKIVEHMSSLNLTEIPDDGQILKRALLKRCIFGVDLNPFAVELARLSLWMDSFIFGTPLSFIEHHVQHGNALMGASVDDFLAHHASEAAQPDLFADDLRARFDELRAVMHELDALRDTTADEVSQSKALWRTRIAPKLALLGRALSLLCTRRVLHAEGEDKRCEALDKTPDLLNQLFDETKHKTEALRLIEGYTARYHFFHYEVAFPEAFAAAAINTTAPPRKGFDIIVGNPPWDKTKFTDTDFFPQYHSNYRTLKNVEKAKVRQRLLESDAINEAYLNAQRSMEVANEYYKAAYPLNKGAGDGNLFRFFVERNLSLLAPGGTLNYVLPSALMFEEGSRTLRHHIFNQFQMPFFYSFENRNGVFPDVDSRYKFALMQVTNLPPTVEAKANDTTIDTAFYVLNPRELDAPERRIAYPLATLKSLSPEQWALMELRDARDLPILQKCYGAFKPLSPQWLDFRNELHMTSDKDLFLEEPASGLVPLYEGKMIWQYSHKLEKPQYWLDPKAFDTRQESKEIHRMAQDLGVPKKEAAKHLASVRYDREFARLGYRAIARDTDERTLIFSLLPKHCGFGHSIFANATKRYVIDNGGKLSTQCISGQQLLFALAWFNSIVTDWIARQMIQINVSQTYLYRLPMPQPSDDEIVNDPDFALLAKNALLLTLAASWDDFSELATLFNLTRNDVPLTAKACDQLRATNDHLIAKRYGIKNDELTHLLKSFPVMANKRPEYLALLRQAR